MNAVFVHSSTCRTQKLVLSIVVALFVVVFVLLTYAVATYAWYVDYSSLHAAIQALWKHENPYQVLLTTHLPQAKLLPANLNPPFTLLAFSPFQYLPYRVGLLLFYSLDMVFSLCAAYLCGYHFLKPSFWHRYRFALVLWYFSLFSTVVGISIVQLGAPLFLLLMLGYHALTRAKESWAAICFALAIASKLFPGVLLFFCLQQRRWRLLGFCLGWCLLFMALPVYWFGIDIYVFYHSMMHRVLWYGDSWNGSLFAVVMRFFIDTRHTNVDLAPYQWLWFAMASGILLAYTVRGRFRCDPKRAFAMALVLMIVLSPFGWVYYFPLLLPAMAISFHEAENGGLRGLLIWFAILSLTNFPVDYVMDKVMESLWLKMTFYSVHSYGALLLMLRLWWPPKPKFHPLYQRDLLFWPVLLLQMLGGLVLLHLILIRAASVLYHN